MLLQRRLFRMLLPLHLQLGLLRLFTRTAAALHLALHLVVQKAAPTPVPAVPTVVVWAALFGLEQRVNLNTAQLVLAVRKLTVACILAATLLQESAAKFCARNLNNKRR